MNKYVLQQLNQSPIAYYPLYKDITSSTVAGVVLSQLMYWFSKKDKFYKTDDDILKETHLSKNELRTAKKIIKNLSFITVTREGVPAKTYYKIDWKLYEFSLVDFTKLDELNSLNSNSDIHETITKTTSKKEREDTFFSVNEVAIKIYIDDLIKEENIKNKKAYKNTMYKKFMNEDITTITVFNEWRLNRNLLKITKNFKDENFYLSSLKGINKEDTFQFLEVTLINQKITACFRNNQSKNLTNAVFSSFNSMNTFLKDNEIKNNEK